MDMGEESIVRIGICDDEVIIRKNLMKLCEEFKSLSMNDIELETFSSGEEVLKYQGTLDILFLDIQMNGLDGLQTAGLLREKDESLIIIFLTGYSGFMQQGYRVKAFRYLLKPVSTEEFHSVLGEAIKDITKNKKAVLALDGSTLFVKLQDIIYVESNNRYTLIRTKRESYECVMTMNEWETLLNNGDFFRVHKAYIVNMAYIDEIGKEVLLENGEKVELSIRQSGKLKKACKELRRRNAR